MQALLVGYGSMGHEVERVLLDRGHSVVARVDPVGGDSQMIESAQAERADIAIEFSHPETVIDNVKEYARRGLTAVIGTTGWFGDLDQARKHVEEAGIGFLYGSNFSIGVHLFYRIVAQATALFDQVPDYDVMAAEMHHNRKKDSPSGTALSLAEVILGNSSKKSRLVTERLDRAVEPDELHVSSTRGGSIPGIHRVIYDSPADTIEIVHSARNRGGFALGSVLAAEWLIGKTGFYAIDDFVEQALR